MKIRFWGVRGSIPTPGPATVRIGGNTSCVEVRMEDRLLILDGGTGLRPLGLALVNEMPIDAILLFSHFHWDHIQGFPFFSPCFIPGNRLEIFGGKGLRSSLRKALTLQMSPPNFPVRFDQLGADMRLSIVREGRVIHRKGIQIRTMVLDHPDRSYSFRIDCDGASLVYATDVEHPPGGVDERLVEFARDADVLIYDAQFTPEEYEGRDGSGRPKRGWGHSTAQEGIKVARSSRVEKLLLFHHDPSHDDRTIRRIEKECQREFPGTTAACEGLEITI